MTIEPTEHRTSIATLKIVDGNVVEIHYHTGSVLTANGIAEVQSMRRKLMGNRPHATFTVLPEDVEYTLETMQQDQGKQVGSRDHLLATVVVAKASMIELLAKLYFSYFPQLHRIYVTDNEAAARAWLKSQLQEIARTGS